LAFEGPQSIILSSHPSLLDLAARRRTLLEDLDARPEGFGWCERHTRIADLVVESIVGDAPVAVIATGGYGRQELAPHSDVDLTVVPVDESSSGLDAVVRRLYRDLHDAFDLFGLRLGYAFRLISDAPGLDAKTRTGLLDMRLVAGDPRPFRPLANALDESFAAGEFALAKIGERREARARTNDTPLVAEPDLKEGAGGLRDFHAANWLRIAVGERPLPLNAVVDAVLLARNLLHRVTGRSQDRLARSRLVEVAARVGRETGEYWDDLARARCGLAAEYERALARLSEARFELSPGVFAVRGEIRLSHESRAGLAAVGVAVGVQLGLPVGDFPATPASDEAGPETMRALASGEPTIRALDAAGLLDRLLPELTALRTRLPQDAIHAYTVMEHTLRAVAELDALPEDGFLGGLLASLPDRSRLVLATLLHDVGKDEGDEGHAERGAKMAEAIARRWRLGELAVADVAWLVREHLTMARFVRVRDLERPDTIDEFARFVGTTERLAMLTLLTYADIRAVAPGVWTPVLDTFLRQLYERAAAHMESVRPVSGEIEGYRRRLVRRLNEGPADLEAIERFVAAMPADYLAGAPAELVAVHLDYAERAARGEPTVEAHPRPDLGATELTIACVDSPGLLSRLLAVLYAHDLGIVALRARTARSDPPVALDTFVATFGGGPIPGATLRAVSDALRAVVRGERTADDVLRARGLDPERRQEIFRWNYAEGVPGILEVRAPRGRGMPYRMARLLAGRDWNVVSARVGQWAGNAAAAFYVVKPDGTAIARDEVAAALTDEA